MKLRIIQATLATAFLILFSGCTTTITNLTPSQHPRNANNLYPFEVTFDTKQKTVRDNTIKPFIMIGTQLYPMEPAPVLKNRWEAQVPIPANTNYVYYRYKFLYDYDRMGAPGEDSRLSPTYQLEIVDK
ncbi:MAG TPA: hypothetical protein VF773_17240 [Verrucomicrobiae bacterium]